MAKRIGILTAGGDAPGLNAAIRGFGKSAIGNYGWELIGFKDGLRGLVENRSVELDAKALSGILTVGGTILGTSRDKVHRMNVDGQVRDMIPTAVQTYNDNRLDAIVQTASSFGSATALEIATEALDRLHSTAHSHHRIILTEIMGHRAGWLALGAGIAGGADVILLPEIPYSVDAIVEKINRRRAHGSTFSVIAVAEGAMSTQTAAELETLRSIVKDASSPENKARAKQHVKELEAAQRANIFTLAEQLEHATGLEARVSILGYVQRGGVPCGADRLLATRLGSAGAAAIEAGRFGVTVADRSHGTQLVPLKDVAGKVKYVPTNHEWIRAAREVGTALGD